MLKFNYNNFNLILNRLLKKVRYHNERSMRTNFCLYKLNSFVKKTIVFIEILIRSSHKIMIAVELNFKINIII